MICACGNAARYIDQHGKLTCGICPLKAGDDSIKIDRVPELLAWARRLLSGDATRLDTPIESLAALRDIVQREPPSRAVNELIDTRYQLRVPYPPGTPTTPVPCVVRCLTCGQQVNGNLCGCPVEPASCCDCGVPLPAYNRHRCDACAKLLAAAWTPIRQWQP